MENQTHETQGERFSRALRWVGTSAVVASGAVFMLQGLYALSSFERFLAFGGMTAALAAAGLFAGLRMKEAKSARTFLGLAAAALPVLFSQLGAMLTSYFPVERASAWMPSTLKFTAPSLLAIGGATLVTIAVMTPILYLGFGAFFRARARDLSIILLMGSVLLLVPTRDPDQVALLLLVQAIALTGFAATARKRPAGEMESLVTGLLPLVPAAILFGRQMFYDVSMYLWASSLLMVAGLMLEVVPYLLPKARGWSPSRILGALSLGGAWACFTSGLVLDFEFLRELSMMLMFYPVALAFMMMSGSLRQLGRIMGILVPIMSVFQNWSIADASVFVTIGFAIGTIGFTARDRYMFESGLLTSALGLIMYVGLSLKLIYAMPWLSLGILGMAAIAGAAWLEKNRTAMAQWNRLYRTHFNRPVLTKVGAE